MAEILFNGRFATLSRNMPDALVVDGTRIAFVGSYRDAEAYAAQSDPAPRRHDIDGRCVIPGLIDMHAHLDREGLKQALPSMCGLRSRREVLERIAELTHVAEPGSWIVTMPIGEPPFYFFDSAEEEAALYPTRDELDEAAPLNPVYIRPILGFWRWAPLPETLISAANSAALAAAGLNDDTASPRPSVHLERDTAKRLTGRFFENTTASILELLYFSRAVRFSSDDRKAALRVSQTAALACGITTIYEGHGCEPAVVDAYEALHRQQALSIRAELAVSPRWQADRSESPAATVARRYAWLAEDGAGDDRLRVRGLFINPLVTPDDQIRSCACGYTGIAGYNFDTGLAPAEAQDVVANAARLGIRCVGLSPALFRLFDTVADGSGARGWTVQHCGHLPPEYAAIAQRRGLGLTFLPVEAIYKQGPLVRADTARLSDWVPLRRLIDAGQLVSLATDNIPSSLFFAIWCCLARRDWRGGVIPDPDGEISRSEALRLATLGAAECLGRADTLGSLAPGKSADLVVLDRDYFTCPLDEIPRIRSVATMVDGAWRYVDSDAPASIRDAVQALEADPC